MAEGAKRPAYVAVAYFGQGAAKLLPLPRGSRLVVDASDASVKSGQTCPEELRKLYDNGVCIYSVQNLHAKVFVFGSKAFVGSTNASSNSAGSLIEAAIITTDRKAVSDAKSFVQGLCLYELGPEAIERLTTLYRPPRFSGVHHQEEENPPDSDKPVISRVFIAQLTLADPPSGSEDDQEAGRKVAEKYMDSPRKHRLHEFWWQGKCPYQPGDVVMQVLDEGDSRRMVSPPGTVVYLRKWQGKKENCTFVYLELPIRRRMKLEKLASEIGQGTEKNLLKNGKVSRNFAASLLQAWNK